MSEMIKVVKSIHYTHDGVAFFFLFFLLFVYYIPTLSINDGNCSGLGVETNYVSGIETCNAIYK